MKIRPYILWNEGRKGEKEKREKGEDVSTHHPPPSILHSSVWPQSIFFLVATVAAIFLMLPVSAGLWEVFRIAVFVQFPWRLLAITTLSLSFLSGSAVVGDRWSLGSFAALASLLIAVVLGSYAYLSPQFIEPAEGPVSLGGLMRFQQSSGELVGLTKWNQEKPKDSPLMPLYVAGQPITSKVVPDSVPSGASVEAIRRTTTLDEVRVKSPSDVQLTFYTQAYPGWKAYVDGVPADLAPTGKLGLISVKVPSGEHVVLLRFETTAPRTIGGLLSGLSVALIAVWGVRRVLQQRAGR